MHRLWTIGRNSGLSATYFMNLKGVFIFFILSGMVRTAEKQDKSIKIARAAFSKLPSSSVAKTSQLLAVTTHKLEIITGHPANR
ncbi:hypothetical protein Tco_0309053 [Tanacetum coccineum]